MKHLKKIILTALLIMTISVTGLLTACKSADTSVTYYKTLLNNYDNLEQKQSVTKSNLRFSLYKGGEISSLEQELNMVKTLNSGNLLSIEGALNTSKSDEMARALIKTLITYLKSTITDMFPSFDFDNDLIYKYFLDSNVGDNGEKIGPDKIFFALGYGNDTYNIKADFCQDKEVPDYVNSKNENIFFGTSETDILSFLKDNNITLSNNKELIDMLIAGYKEIFPFEKMTAKAKYIVNEKVYLHTLALSDTDIKDTLRQKIAEVIELLSKEEVANRGIIDLLKSQTEEILSWFSFSDYNLNIKVASSGELLSIKQNVNVSISISDEALLKLATSLGGNKEEIRGYIELAHWLGFGSSDTSTKNKFDFLINYSNENQFIYENILIKHKDLITASSTNLDKRTIVQYIEDINNPTKKIWKATDKVTLDKLYLVNFL